MKIILNGRPLELSSPVTLTGLLAELELSPQKIAIERNLEIVPKSAFEELLLEEGDRLEIVQFVGGG